MLLEKNPDISVNRSIKPVSRTKQDARHTNTPTRQQKLSDGRLRAKGRVSVDDGMNSLERKYSQYLRALQLAGEIHNYKYERHNLKLADKTYYKPDFEVILPDGSIEFHETKGFMRDDANVKVKVAASQFPQYVFRLVQWNKKTGCWTIKQYPPRNLQEKMTKMPITLEALFDGKRCGLHKDGIEKRCLFMHCNDEFGEEYCGAFLNSGASKWEIDRNWNHTPLKEIGDTMTFKRCQACLDYFHNKYDYV